MYKFLVKHSLALALFAAGSFIISSCSSKAHCPGVASTGNSATMKHAGGGNRKAHCPGNASTGNFKPKVKNRKEDGLTSKKMDRVMSKTSGSATEE